MLIKFKVYDEKNKQYKKKPCIYGEHGLVDYDLFEAQEHLTVLGFTGLKDRANQDIYEGDIVYDDIEEELGVVEWDKDMAKWIVTFDNIIYGLGDGLNDSVEVVANYPTTIESYIKENESVEDED